jgi:predicted metalloprotease
MRLGREKPSENIEDRRGMDGGFGTPGGGGIRVPIGGRGGIGIGGIIVLLLLWLVFGINPLELLSGGGIQIPRQTETPTQTGEVANDEMKDFVARVLGSTERVWTEKFQAMGRRYDPPSVVLFSNSIQSACGRAQAAVGPFYCPPDQKVYIDLSFFEELQSRFGATGDFAQAYVIAHEVGHHVQKLLGIADKVTQARMQAPEAEANDLSVRMELQADCLAGVWAKSADDSAQILEAGDIEEGLNAASAIGDDRLQKRSQGYVVPESFTHGSSEQRVRWFKRGLDTADMNQCETFKAQSL